MVILTDKLCDSMCKTYEVNFLMINKRKINTALNKIKPRQLLSFPLLVAMSNFVAPVSLAEQASTSSTSSDQLNNKLNIEELRIGKATKAFPGVVNRHQALIDELEKRLSVIETYDDLQSASSQFANLLWLEAIKSIKLKKDGDDRALYWARLKMSKAIKQSAVYQKLPETNQQDLLWQFELVSRGKNDAAFDQNTKVKILVTGFDPFFLDRHIDQSNPSGVAAMMLDGQVIEYNGVQAEIESFVVPVRFADFDQGIIEQLLTPYIKGSKAKSGVDFVFTISMGREDFDIERFPSLRRSAKAPDNLNVYTGASSSLPLVPRLNGLPLNGSEYKGAEFVEFSLPVEVMQKADTHFKVIDNRKISTLTSKLEPDTLSELAGKVSVSGSGGGYLSNEISYRSILIRNRYNPILHVGHIHTPRIAAFEPKISIIITEDIKKILEQVSFNLDKTD